MRTRRDTRATHDRIEVVAELLGRGAKVPAAELRRSSSVPEEPSLPGDVYADYVRAPYEPSATPVGKLRSVNLLYETFALMGLDAPGAALVELLRRRLGQGKTVWGAKHLNGRITWELYFYDPERSEPAMAVDALRALLAPLIRVEPRLPRPIEWHMYSVEIAPEHLRGAPIDRLHVYVNGLDRHGSSRSYAYTVDGARLENLYTFHDARTQVREVVARLRTSVHLNLDRTTIASALWPELFRCRRICVANKPFGEGMYFSGVGIDQATYMMQSLGWPRAIWEYAQARRDRFDHLRWDVGFDFHTPPGEASPRTEKSAIYATF